MLNSTSLANDVSPVRANAYWLIMAMTSTRHSVTRETPSCISNDLGYYQDRVSPQLYIDPQRLVPRFNSVVVNYNLQDHLGSQASTIWDFERYIFVGGFNSFDTWTNSVLEDPGFFDIKHAAMGYEIQMASMGLDIGLETVEALWEGIIQFGRCQSALILEDIVSNHAGAEAADRFANDLITKSAGEYLEDILSENGSIQSRSQAVTSLNQQGIPVLFVP